jgi:hypothetical protein
MTAYTPYMVAPSSTAISTYLKPWLQPEDALVNMEDCYTYRGVIQKRYGYGLFDDFPDGVGIFHLGAGDGTTTAFAGSLPYTPVGKRSLQISHTQGGVLITDGTDDGAGGISGTNIAAGSTINYASGAVVLNFTAAPDANTGIRVDFGVRIGIGDGVTTTFTPNLNSIIPGLPIFRQSVFIKNTSTNQFTPTTFDVPNSSATIGTLTNVPNGVTAGTVTYASGAISVTFATPPPAAAANQDIWARWQFLASSEPIKGIKFFWTSDGSQQTLVFNDTMMAVIDNINRKLVNVSGPNYFNTGVKNFFSVANYIGKAFIVNNTDRLTVWDGTFLFQPVVSINSGAPLVNVLTTALFVTVFKNRLILFRPTISAVVKPQRAMYSALNNPFNWFSDVQGAGGFIEAATPEWIISEEFLRDEVIGHFQDSTWKFRYTGIDTAPYRWEKINDMRRVDCPYATTSYQNYDTAVGATGLIRCDGVNVERYDDKIIDFTEDNINQDNIEICNSYRFDNLNQQLICYQSKELTVPTDYCDKWLVWNFLENSFALFNIPATTFGAYYGGRDLAWQDFTEALGLDYSWEDFQEGQNWLSYFAQRGAKIPLFGTKDGQVMELFPFFSTDNGTRTGFEFLTKDFNPFIQAGQRCVFGYVDFYFDRPSAPLEYDPDYLLSIDFYSDEQESPTLTLVLNPSEDDWQKKRVFVNSNAQFHRFRMYLSEDQIATSTVATNGFTLNGYILYFAPGGRISGV